MAKYREATLQEWQRASQDSKYAELVDGVTFFYIKKERMRLDRATAVRYIVTASVIITPIFIAISIDHSAPIAIKFIALALSMLIMWAWAFERHVAGDSK